jgi:hypothetical protein
VSTLPHDVSDLHLAPLLLALDARLSELGLLDRDELMQRVAIESDRPDRTATMRRAGLLESVRHFIDLRGWELAWDPRGLRVGHGRHHVVLGAPPVFQEYVDGTGPTVALVHPAGAQT